MRVGGEHPVLAGERRHQHQQRAFRQMEVGEQRVDAADAVTRENEDPGFPRERLQFAFAGVVVAHRAFERTHHRRAHRNHATAALAGAAHLRDQFGAHVQPFAVHAMFAHVVGAHRLERAGADVEGHVPEFDAAVAQRLQQRFVEMQAGGGRGDCADFLREHGLVTLVVVGPRLAADVRRQRQPAGMQQPAFQPFADVEAQVVELTLAAQHLGFAAGIQRDPAARLRRFAGADLRPRLVAGQQAFDQDLHAPAGGLLAEQARRDHPGVVEDQQVAGLQQPGQVAHRAVLQLARRLRHHQQAAGGAFGQGGLGDQGFGQLEMEVGFLHRGARNRARIVAGRPRRPRPAGKLIPRPRAAAERPCRPSPAGSRHRCRRRAPARWRRPSVRCDPRPRGRGQSARAAAAA